MTNWVARGLRSGIRSSGYPAKIEASPGTSPGRPVGTRLDRAAAEALQNRCPTGAISARENGIAVAHGRCIHCFLCAEGEARAVWEKGFEWGAHAEEAGAAQAKLARIFGRSLHIRFVDAGACGACVSEARQLNNPYYNMHRLGFFVTPSPRKADVLMVAGPVSDAMRLPLQKAYEAMPAPKRVVAIGACALSGGVFGPSFAALGGAQDVIPVDVAVPGCPPPPLAILHGLLLLAERKPPAALHSPPP